MVVNTDDIRAFCIYGTVGFHFFSISIRVVDFYVKQTKYYNMLTESNEDMENMMNTSNAKEKKIIQEMTTYCKTVSFILINSTKLSAIILIILHLVLGQGNPLNLLKVSKLSDKVLIQ